MLPAGKRRDHTSRQMSRSYARLAGMRETWACVNPRWRYEVGMVLVLVMATIRTSG